MSAQQDASSPLFNRNLLKTVWATLNAQDTDSGSKAADANYIGTRIPLGWILGSAAAVLVAVVGLVAWMSIHRSEAAMSNLLAEKGSSLLRAFESALRTGMRSSTGLQLQMLLEEMSRAQDVEFVAVTMPDGVILAHSSRDRIGEILSFEEELLNSQALARLAPGTDEKWLITNVEGKRVFLLYRHFTMGNKNWPKDVPEPTIFLGMDVSPFEITNSQNRSYIAMLSVVIMLVGMACLLALTYAQRAAEFRLRHRRAEGEVHRLEEEIRRQEKLAAIGTLAAGVAHEIRNPLSSIKGYATYFSQRFPEGSDDREAATVMVNEVNRLNRVITDLLGLSKPDDVKLQPVHIENMVSHVLRLIRHNASEHNVVVSCNLAPHIPEILADMERLSQALLNLCLNAIDAMPDGGSLDIAVSGGKKYVCLIVRDTGTGIPADIMSKIFDPYFTTKGAGTGLGLPMVHKIVRAHKGTIEVSSTPPKQGSQGIVPGATIFRIWLPTAPAS